MKDGRLVAGSSKVVARSGVGVAVKKGAPRPDISTADALRRTRVVNDVLSDPHAHHAGTDRVSHRLPLGEIERIRQR